MLEWAHSHHPSDSVDYREWAHRTGNVNVLEWAHSHHRVVLSIILYGPIATAEWFCCLS
jgi:hypothetical protein